jgi:hypothetical protein
MALTSLGVVSGWIRAQTKQLKGLSPYECNGMNVTIGSAARSDQLQARKDRQLNSERYHRWYPGQYAAVLIERWASGVFPVFVCHRCGLRALDPCGRDGKHEFLCDSCADGAASDGY